MIRLGQETYETHETHESGKKVGKIQTNGGLMDRTFIPPLQPSPGFDVHVGHGTCDMYIIC